MRALSVRRCALPLLCVLGSCAWSNPDNRPVWRAFEERVVPVEDGWFYSSLPVTVPLGFGAILCDVLVAHPAAVIDDAWYDDLGDYWTTLAWDTHRYLNIYTNSASGYLGYVPDIPQGGIVGDPADRVVVLQDGAVAEVGTHPELMEGGGVYRQLVERQFTEVPVLSS